MTPSHPRAFRLSCLTTLWMPAGKKGFPRFLEKPDETPEPCAVRRAPHRQERLQSAALRRMLNISVRYSTCGTPLTPAFAMRLFRSSEAMKERALSKSSHSNRSVNSLGFCTPRKIRQLRSPLRVRQSSEESNTDFHAG